MVIKVNVQKGYSLRVGDKYFEQIFMEITCTGTGCQYPILGQGQTLTPGRNTAEVTEIKRNPSLGINEVHTSAGEVDQSEVIDDENLENWKKKNSRKKNTYVVSIHFWVQSEFFVNIHVGNLTPLPCKIK